MEETVKVRNRSMCGRYTGWMKPEMMEDMLPSQIRWSNPAKANKKPPHLLTKYQISPVTVYSHQQTRRVKLRIRKVLTDVPSPHPRFYGRRSKVSVVCFIFYFTLIRVFIYRSTSSLNPSHLSPLLRTAFHHLPSSQIHLRISLLLLQLPVVISTIPVIAHPILVLQKSK
jgi:hypothetical protein